MYKSIRYGGVLISLLVIAGMVDQFLAPQTTTTMRERAQQYAEETIGEQPRNQFVFDGCTLWPDQVFGSNFTSACLEHDIRYWVGGSDAMRQEADLALKESIMHTGSFGEILAPIMHAGVRFAGDSLITKAVGANWGFGFNK